MLFPPVFGDGNAAAFIAREMINRIQNLRKDSGLDVTDKIILYLKEDETLKKVFAEHAGYIKQETLSEDLVFQSQIEEGESVAFDQIETIIKLEKR